MRRIQAYLTHPTVGRFLVRDPGGYGASGLNLYAYCGNNPVNLVDPSGMKPGDFTDPNANVGYLNAAANRAVDHGHMWEATGFRALAVLVSYSGAPTFQSTGEAWGNPSASGWTRAKDAALTILFVTGAIGGGSPGAAEADAANLAKAPNRIYSARVLMRSAEEPGPFHNFPESFNQAIFEQGARTVTRNFYRVVKAGLSNDAVMYRQEGVVNGVIGTFEIGVRPSISGKTEVIMHLFFRPGR